MAERERMGESRSNRAGDNGEWQRERENGEWERKGGRGMEGEREGPCSLFNNERRGIVLPKDLWRSPLLLGAEARFDCSIEKETHKAR